MEICRQDQALEIRELDPFLAELLRQIPESARPKDSAAAEERLFSAPAAAGGAMVEVWTSDTAIATVSATVTVRLRPGLSTLGRR